MRILWITGAGGVLGGKLVAQATQLLHDGAYDHICAFTHTPIALGAAGGHPPITHPALTYTTLDIGDREVVQAAAREAAPSVILNPAAMTNVDACERERTQAEHANVAGPHNLAQVAREHGAHLLHVSTDYVFPGDDAQPGPYHEDDPTRPINYYGLTKLQGDEAVARACGDEAPYAIVRTALVYGTGGRSNFVKWLSGELMAGRRVRIVNDQFNTPTIADDLASLLLWLADSQTTGIYHAAGPERVGRHEWALAIAERFGLDSSLIDWVSTAELNQLAPRPRFSGLLCERLAADQSQRGAPKLRGILAGLRDIDWGLAPAPSSGGTAGSSQNAPTPAAHEGS